MANTLTEEQYLPLAVALEHRRREQQRGLKLLLTPVPACLECGQPPSTIAVDQDHAFTSDITLVKLSCGHVYEIAGDLIGRTAEQVWRTVDAEENRPAGTRAEPPEPGSDYDEGGWLPAEPTTVRNDTGQPIAVRPMSQ